MSFLKRRAKGDLFAGLVVAFVDGTDLGRIFECGSHDEPLRAGGRYAQLWLAQSTTHGGDFDLVAAG